jgi:ABC-type nitrate/sulfonate/bicarbonate transport system substrate-binding protein
MKFITRRGFMGAAAAGSALALGACASGETDATTTAEDGTSGTVQLTFVLDYTPNTNHTGIYVALAKGWYEEEGIDLTVVQPPEDGADAMVGSGQAELGMSYQDVMANYLGSSQPLPVTAIAAVIQHNTSGIISRQGDGITTPAGLEGKRYGTWDQAVEQAMVKSVVETDGGDFSQVTLVPANSADEISGLKADMFDAIWCFEAWAGQNAIVQDYPVDYWSFISIDDTFDYYTPVIIANDDYLAQNPDVIARFLAATAKGYEYASENPDDAAELLVEANPEIDAELAKVSQEYLADKYTADASQWGVFDADRWNRFYEWMNEEGLVEVEIPDDTGFTNDYLPAQS